MLNPVKWDITDDGFFTYHGVAAVDETLGDRLRKAKKAKKVGNAAIAAASGVSEVTISRWLNDRTTPDPAELDRAARFLGVTSDWLRNGGDVTPGRLTVREDAQEGYSPAARARRLLPPRAYARMYEYLKRLESAGADVEQLEEAERIMADTRYSKLNKRTGREPTEEETMGDIDAGWAWVWELATRGGLKIPGPRPEFEEG